MNLQSYDIATFTGKTESFLSAQLKEQLKNKRMIFFKSQLELSSTVGQGMPAMLWISNSCASRVKDLFFLFHVGESGLVYRGYLNTAAGKELVAIKTVKGKTILAASLIFTKDEHFSSTFLHW